MNPFCTHEVYSRQEINEEGQISKVLLGNGERDYKLLKRFKRRQWVWFIVNLLLLVWNALMLGASLVTLSFDLDKSAWPAYAWIFCSAAFIVAMIMRQHELLKAYDQEWNWSITCGQAHNKRVDQLEERAVVERELRAGIAKFATLLDEAAKAFHDVANVAKTKEQ